MNRLKQIRTEQGKTQNEVARFANIQPQKVADFEHGRRDLRLNEAKRVADFFGISLDELVSKSELASPSNDDASE